MYSLYWIVIILYGLGMLFIFLYSLVQLSLLVAYRKKRIPERAVEILSGDLPEVLIQLPVYNELYVVERLIDAACHMDYPQEKLEIQVLDDGSDASVELAAARVAYWKAKGFRIQHVQRAVREGFKAGALQYGMGLSDAPFIAVFDADFIPEVDFLQRTIPAFHDAHIGMVQTRWGHLNRNYSLLTRVQAFALDAHFTIEQTGRNLGAHFMNFNGTAGVWRRTCIQEAGGWSADTLTEDLDLSYRAQLRGWQFKFMEGVVAPAELPGEMNALKSQQYRWNKGAAECAVKHLGAVMGDKKLTPATRIHAFFHLMNSSIFIWIVVCAVLSLPLIIIKSNHPTYASFFHIGGILLLSFVILGGYYYTAFRKTDGKSPWDFIWLYPAFLSVSMGMSLHNMRAVMLGFAGKKTPFIRTPKWNLIGGKGEWKHKNYLDTRIPWLTWVEGFLCIYFIFALLYGITIGEWGFLPLHVMLVFGFFTVFFYSLKHALGR